METLSPLELLQPETQALIMCHISSATSFYALLRASPRFYQVFRSRRAHFLTRLAKQQTQAPVNAWDAIKASRLPKPLSHADVETFTRTFEDDDGHEAPILPVEASIPMIKLGTCVAWLTADFARSTLPNLIRLGELTELSQERDSVSSDLSSIEKARIARAFYRFEIFRHLFPPAYHGEWSEIEKLQPGVDLLNQWDPDEIEEIACIKDYVLRRLCTVFDQMEDDLVRGDPSEPVRIAAQASQDDLGSPNWFGSLGSAEHNSYMENIMSLGLPFIKEILSADWTRRAKLVFSASKRAGGFLSDTMDHFNIKAAIEDEDPESRRFSPVHFHKSYHDTLDQPSLGWHWILLDYKTVSPGRSQTQGPRDWGYIFWDKRRMLAAGVLRKPYKPPFSGFSTKCTDAVSTEPSYLPTTTSMIQLDIMNRALCNGCRIRRLVLAF